VYSKDKRHLNHLVTSSEETLENGSWKSLVCLWSWQRPASAFVMDESKIPLFAMHVP